MGIVSATLPRPYLNKELHIIRECPPGWFLISDFFTRLNCSSLQALRNKWAAGKLPYAQWRWLLRDDNSFRLVLDWKLSNQIIERALVQPADYEPGQLYKPIFLSEADKKKQEEILASTFAIKDKALETTASKDGQCIKSENIIVEDISTAKFKKELLEIEKKALELDLLKGRVFAVETERALFNTIGLELKAALQQLVSVLPGEVLGLKTLIEVKSKIQTAVNDAEQTFITAIEESLKR